MYRDASMRPLAVAVPLDASWERTARFRGAVADSEGRRVVEQQPTFEDFIAARSRQLQRTAYLLTRDHHLAQDLVQTTYAKVWPAWSRISGDEPEAYVRRVMLNTYTSWWRRRWRGETPTEELPDDGRPGDQDRVVDRAGLWAALGRLPARQRAVVVLRYFEDLSESETARLLGCSTGNVKSQASRALAKLRLDPTLLAAKNDRGESA